VALFLGVAFAAQLEAVRAGAPTPATADPLATERPTVATEEPVLPYSSPGYGNAATTPPPLSGAPSSTVEVPVPGS
jgi:hypothetical protein